MVKTGIAESIDRGNVTFTGGNFEIDAAWHEHPKFPGVYLKHIICGKHTDGLFSSHVVRIDPHAALEEHVHEGQWELHEVIEGEGLFMLDSKESLYHPGRMGIIPKGIRHRVAAGSGGLVVLAKFFPALF